MKKIRKSLGLFIVAFALCMVFGISAKVNAADVEMKIGNAGSDEVQMMNIPDFAVNYISSDKSTASFSIQYSYDGQITRIGVFDINGNLVVYDDAYSYATVNGLRKNQVYYYRAMTVTKYGVPTSGWSEAKSFTTAESGKFKFKGVEGQKACTIKVPKIKGVKNYTLYLSKKRDSGFKKVKTIKPGKKVKLTKFKKKSFKLGNTYYLRVLVKTKDNITCGNYYYSSVYFYRTLRF